jgi:A/G-specific adenine glycosylase
LERRENKGLLAGLWQFPNVSGKMDVSAALNAVEKMQLQPCEIFKIVERKHIFTHIEWHMNGVFVEVADTAGDFTWLDIAQIRNEAALPTAFRQFVEDILDV